MENYLCKKIAYTFAECEAVDSQGSDSEYDVSVSETIELHGKRKERKPRGCFLMP